MRIELIEKVVVVLAAIAIVAVAGFVTVFTIWSKDSFISKEEIDAEDHVVKWLEEARDQASGHTGPRSNVLVTVPSAPATGVAAAPGSPAPQKPGTPGAPPPAAPAQPGAPGHSENYFDPNAQIPPDQQVAGIPWLRKQEGVTYMRPEPVSQILYQKYQSFDDAWEAAQEGGGEFVNGRYRINWVQEDSYLRSKVGLQPGDEVISVNGHPIGASFNASRGLYDQLKGEKRFAVKVLRNGQEVVLSFYVN